jgi:hypothetical protein
MMAAMPIRLRLTGDIIGMRRIWQERGIRSKYPLPVPVRGSA